MFYIFLIIIDYTSFYLWHLFLQNSHQLLFRYFCLFSVAIVLIVVILTNLRYYSILVTIYIFLSTFLFMHLFINILAFKKHSLQYLLGFSQLLIISYWIVEVPCILQTLKPCYHMTCKNIYSHFMLPFLYGDCFFHIQKLLCYFICLFWFCWLFFWWYIYIYFFFQDQ